MLIDDFLKEKYSGLKYKQAVFKKNEKVLLVDLIYNPDIFDYNDEIIKKIKDDFQSKFDFYIKININMIKSVLDEQVIANRLYIDLNNYFPAINQYLESSDIKVRKMGGADIKISVKIPQNLQEYVNSSNKDEEIKKMIESSFFCNAFIDFPVKEIDFKVESNESKIEHLESIKLPNLENIYDINSKINVIGKNTYNTAVDFMSIKEAVNNCVVCGVIKNLTKRSFMKKNNKNPKEEIEQSFFTFSIQLNNNYLSVSVFCKEFEISSIEAIPESSKIAMKGYFKLYKDKLNFVATEICICDFLEKKDTFKYKSVNNEYHIIKPELYIEPVQMQLFDNEKFSNPNMKGSFVVFDLETTGLSADNSEIIEIGAVKVIDDKITDCFSALIKPSMPIPSMITELTGIDDEMVKDSHSIYEVFPDFYKFCYGCDIVAYNIEFDYSFISVVAKKMLYNFDNNQIDALVLARQKLKGPKNYKLGSICEFLGIQLDNAHRAVYDAAATAKIFIKLY